MPSRITVITLHHLFGVNCYLIETAGGHVLIDTGLRPRRRELEGQLRRAGCRSGSLRLIILTHGHVDHAGNCACLRDASGAPVAMHAADAGKVERGDMFWTAGSRRSAATAVARAALFATGLGRFTPFEPDVLLGDGQHLGGYGLDATVLHTPGHSPGSICVLTREGDLFCGDLLTNTRRPRPNSMVEDAREQRASVARLRELEIATVYPGHGLPFPIGLLEAPAGGGRRG